MTVIDTALPELSSGDLNRLLTVMTEVTVREGVVVARQGSPVRQFGIVVDGELARFERGNPAGVLQRGAHFGSSEIRQGRGWQETLVAARETQVIVGHDRDLKGLATASDGLARLFGCPVDPSRRAVTRPRIRLGRIRLGVRARRLSLD